MTPRVFFAIIKEYTAVKEEAVQDMAQQAIWNGITARSKRPITRVNQLVKIRKNFKRVSRTRAMEIRKNINKAKAFFNKKDIAIKEKGGKILMELTQKDLTQNAMSVEEARKIFE